MNGGIRQNRALLAVNAAVLFGLTATWAGYSAVGRPVIEAIYGGPWIELLHKLMMMEGRDILPLERYFSGAETLLRSATVAGAVAVGASTLMVTCPPRIATRVLGAGFALFALSASALAFFYPLEIETRESTVWLHVLAMREGIKIYDHSQVAFINQNHGPFDPLFKSGLAALFPYLEPWQVTRFAVFVLPYGFLFAARAMLRKSGLYSPMDAVYLGAVGFLLLVISAKEFLFVGRSDATAALLLLPLTYFSCSAAPKHFKSAVLAGMVWGCLGISVALTNWRMLPAVFALFLFSLWALRERQGARFSVLVSYGAGCAIAMAGIFTLVLYWQFDFDLALYYKHFFGVYSHSSGHGHGTYAHASVLWFLGSLWNPVASADNLKGGPLLIALMVYLLIPGKGSPENKAWLVLGAFLFAACTIAYYLNYYGGGQWYYIPFLIVWWFFLCANYRMMPRCRLSAAGIGTAALLALTFTTTVVPSAHRGTTLGAAHEFLQRVRALQQDHTVLSEDMFFYRTAYGGERIDMGDMVSKIRARGGEYYGEAFNRTVDAHFEQLSHDPPDFIVKGFAESAELRRLIAARYVEVGAGPNNLTANGVARSRLFRRKDLSTSAAGRLGAERRPAAFVSGSR